MGLHDLRLEELYNGSFAKPFISHHSEHLMTRRCESCRGSGLTLNHWIGILTLGVYYVMQLAGNADVSCCKKCGGRGVDFIKTQERVIGKKSFDGFDMYEILTAPKLSHEDIVKILKEDGEIK